MASVTTQLADQLDWRWRARLRPRLDGLTDHEQFWQPVPNCWTVHPDDSVDFVFPPRTSAAVRRVCSQGEVLPVAGLPSPVSGLTRIGT